jgi:hypothetical protein
VGPEITMTDYQIQNSRRCSATGRELKPGERFFSVLIDEGGKFVRQDYSQEGWPGPPRGALGYWQGRLSSRDAPRRPPLDEETLLECFHRLEGEDGPDKVRFRFVLALLLLRRKRLRLEGSEQSGGQEVLLVRCPRTGARSAVIDPKLSDGELEAVQDDVFDVLGWR